MASPDPEGMSLLTKALIAATAVVPPIWGARSWLEKRFASKASKEDLEKHREDVEKTFVLMHGELSRHRDVQAKIFDKIEANEKASSARHQELLMHLLERKS